MTPLEPDLAHNEQELWMLLADLLLCCCLKVCVKDVYVFLPTFTETSQSHVMKYKAEILVYFDMICRICNHPVNITAIASFVISHCYLREFSYFQLRNVFS